MRLFAIIVTFIVSIVAPEILEVVESQIATSCPTAVNLDAKTNVWKEYTLHANSFWRNQVLAAADAINATDTSLKERAVRFANAGNFLWIEGTKDVGKIEEAVKDVPCNHILGLVLAGLVRQDCSDSPPGTDGEYQLHFVKPITDVLKAHPNTAFALIIEPFAMRYVVPNHFYPANKSCDSLRDAYRRNVPYALQSFDLPNAIVYLDAEHGGIFGWKDGDVPKLAVTELTKTWQAANGANLKQFRGVAINTRNYNAWDMSPGEAFKDENALCAVDDNAARNEKNYLLILSSALKKVNSSMPFHAIMDTTRSAVQGIRLFWNDWCNVNGAGFGRRFSNVTGDSILDAFVWATPAGQSDGSSELVAACGPRNISAYKPMPKRGEWSQAYFEMILKEARPSKSKRSNVKTVKRLTKDLKRRCEDG